MSENLCIETQQVFDRVALQTLLNSSDLSKDIREKLNIIKRESKKNGGSMKTASLNVRYKMPSTKQGNLGFGRLVGCKYSLDKLDSEYRDTLLKGLYYNIDMQNAQPTICSQLMKKLDIKCPELDYYVANRDTVIKQVMDSYGLTRSEAKQKMLAILYGQKTDGFLEPYSKEARRISREILKVDEYVELYNTLAPSKLNSYGSLLSHVTATEECKCLMATIKLFKSKGWQADILNGDGLNLRIREDTPFTEDLLCSAAEFVKNKTGYEIVLLEKPLIGLELPKEPLDGPCDGVTKEAYEAMKLKFESVAGMFEDTGKIFYVKDDGKIITMDKTTALDTLNPLFNFKGPTRWKSIPFLPLWLTDSSRRCVSNFTYDTNTDVEGSFVLPFNPAWKRVSEPEDSERYVSKFIELLNVLAPEKDLRDALVEWLAHIIQKPFENSLCAVVIAGMKGCGKDTLGDFINTYLVGEQFSTNYTSSEQFWDKYDTGRHNKIFVKLEEASGTLNKANEAGLKARVTSVKERYNPKGCPAFDAPNFCRIFMTTNESNPVSTDKNERRFLLIHSSNAKVGKISEFWKPLRELLFTKEGGSAVGHWLSRQNCGIWPRILPQGSLAMSMIEDSKSPLVRFIESETAWSSTWLTAGELYEIYKSWCDAMTFMACKSSIGLGRQLNTLVIDGILNKRMIHGYSQYSKK